jgi:acyl-CoA synthetase (AMP-forming)/AMP-acid ligase II/acyl carrier protein
VYSYEKIISSDDRLTLLHSLSFGSADIDLSMALLNGGSLFPLDMKTAGMDGLVNCLREERITVCHLPPAVFRQLPAKLFPREKLPSLRLIWLSGASVNQQDLDLYKNYFDPRTALEIEMGSTETKGICSFVVGEGFRFPEAGAPVGYPHKGREVLLLDERQRSVGSTDVGEIAVRSRYLALGYWNNLELTRAKFLPDPAAGDRRIFLTGDLGRMLPNGFFIHLGRKDLQIKIRGYRVEAAEVEKALRAQPGVKDATVVALERESTETALTAYVVAAKQPAPTVTELRNSLRNQLPEYMIPSRFVFLDALPLAPHGKVDPRALPEPGNSRPELEISYLPPRTPTETELARIWSEVLSIDPVGIHDNFFDLGGHSLAATRVVSQVIKKFQLELPLQSLFQSPTIAEMAAVIGDHQGKQVEGQALERILSELESLSEEEARRLLGTEKKRATD